MPSLPIVGRMVIPKRYVHWEAGTGTLFGNWVLADVIKDFKKRET